MARFRCPVCEYVYDEVAGAPREGFPPGTAWADVPDDWCCPDCAVREKVDFEPVAEQAAP
jgi:rubredoxin